MKRSFPGFFWGLLFLLAAVFIVIRQFDNFINIGIGSIIIALMALAFILHCIINLNFAPLPIPLAVLYYTFQLPFDWPYVQIYTLIVASILAWIGLSILLPKRYSNKFFYYKIKHKKYDSSDDSQAAAETDFNNNPSVSVKFGETKRHLRAESLESAMLHCNFGALEIYFDQVVLNPNGAVIDLNCSFGAIELYVPRNWHVRDNINCSFGGVDIDKNFSPLAANVPQLTLTGSVSFGGIEVHSM